MGYLLPRAVFLLVAWGMSCALIRKLLPEADPVIFALAGASWIAFGAAYFAYLRRLKRDIAAMERNRHLGDVRRVPT
jgi:hypothetical protein